MKDLSQDRRYPGWESIRVVPDLNFRALPLNYLGRCSGHQDVHAILVLGKIDSYVEITWIVFMSDVLTSCTCVVHFRLLRD
jgi:hypothetical protein